MDECFTRSADWAFLFDFKLKLLPFASKGENMLAKISKSRDIQMLLTPALIMNFLKHSQKLAASPTFLLAPAPIRQKLWPYISLPKVENFYLENLH